MTLAARRYLTTPTVAVLVVATSVAVHVQNMKLTYPETRKGDVVDDYFGTKVPDPYRWMEDLDSPDVAAWRDAQNALTFSYLGRLPLRDRLRERRQGRRARHRL